MNLQSVNVLKSPQVGAAMINQVGIRLKSNRIGTEVNNQVFTNLTKFQGWYKGGIPTCTNSVRTYRLVSGWKYLAV